jgi:cell division septation protein DedD
MDPLGRFLLARAVEGDSVYVVSVPLARMVQTIFSQWRADLPTVTPDGALLALQRADVGVIEPESGTERARVRGGAQDRWAFVRWDGFRPRDRSLDAPAVFETDTPADSAAAAEMLDSLLTANALRVASELDSIGRATAGRQLQDDSSAVATASGFTVSFASLLSESAARALADRIRIDGRRPRVVATTSDGVTIYRVVAGPFATREAAVAAGQRSGVPFWVFVGLP